jgi:hypothetical protein
MFYGTVPGAQPSAIMSLSNFEPLCKPAINKLVSFAGENLQLSLMFLGVAGDLIC